MSPPALSSKGNAMRTIESRHATANEVSLKSENPRRILTLLLCLPGLAAADPAQEMQGRHPEGAVRLRRQRFHAGPPRACPALRGSRRRSSKSCTSTATARSARQRVTVANPFGDLGNVAQPPSGAPGLYSINEDCSGTVQFLDANNVTYKIFVDPPQGHTIWMIQTNPANNVFQGNRQARLVTRSRTNVPLRVGQQLRLSLPRDVNCSLALRRPARATPRARRAFPWDASAAVVTRAIGGIAESVAMAPSFLATPKDAIDSVPRKGVSGRDFRDSSAIDGNEPGCLRCFLGHTPRRQRAAVYGNRHQHDRAALNGTAAMRDPREAGPAWFSVRSRLA